MSILRSVSLAALWACVASGCTLSAELERGPSGPELDGGAGRADAAAADDASARPLPPPFADDFERANGEVSAPWIDLGLGTPSLWFGQLCLDRKEMVTVELTPGRHGYAAVSVTGGAGLVWSLESRDGALTTVQWNTGLGDLARIESVTGEDLGPYSPIGVNRLEVAIDHDARRARARLDGGAWVDLELDPALVADVERMRFGVLALHPDEPADEPVCFDNVYAGPHEPDADPFADSPRPRVGGYTANTLERCLFDHCGSEVVACMEPQTTCALDYGLIPACLHGSPDGMVAHCSADLPVADAPTDALAACADLHCATDVDATPMEFEGYGDHYDPPAVDDRGRILVLLDRPEGITPAVVDLLTGDIELDRALPLTAQTLAPEEAFTLASDYSHWMAFVTLREAGGARRLFHRDDLDDGVHGWSEVLFGAPIVSTQGFAEGVWVVTAPREPPAMHTLHLLGNAQATRIDGGPSYFLPGLHTLFRRTEPSGSFGELWNHASESGGLYSLLSVRDKVLLLSAQGEAEVGISGLGTDWSVAAYFDSSVVLEAPGYGRVWLELSGARIQESLTGTMAGPYLITEDTVWLTGLDELLHVGPLPAGFVPEVDRPVASDWNRVLYMLGGEWRVVDTRGVTAFAARPASAELDAESVALEPARAVAHGLSCALLVSRGTTSAGAPVSALDVLRTDELGEVTLSRLDVLRSAPEALALATRGGQLFAWPVGDELRAYDCPGARSHSVALEAPLMGLWSYRPPVPHER
jgi:hypothetical protein